MSEPLQLRRRSSKPHCAGEVDAANENQLKFALEKQQRDGGKIGDILISLGYITDREIIKALTEQASDI